MKEWIEINSEQDLPNEELFCWWVNRTNGTIHPSKLKGQMARSLTHLTFSHYMVIDNVPTPPIEMEPLEKFEEMIEKSKKLLTDVLDVCYDDLIIDKTGLIKFNVKTVLAMIGNLSISITEQNTEEYDWGICIKDGCNNKAIEQYSICKEHFYAPDSPHVIGFDDSNK